MKKKTRSILDELNRISESRNTEHFLETTGSNLIESAVNLLGVIQSHYPEETAIELERRFINSIRSGDPRKFKRGIDKIIESKAKDEGDANSK